MTMNCAKQTTTRASQRSRAVRVWGMRLLSNRIGKSALEPSNRTRRSGSVFPTFAPTAACPRTALVRKPPQYAESGAIERLFGALHSLTDAAEQRDRRLWRARAQPQGHLAHPSPRLPRGHHGAVGVGKVVVGLRHDLCGGPAPLRRVAERVRAAVPRADGQARR